MQTVDDLKRVLQQLDDADLRLARLLHRFPDDDELTQLRHDLASQRVIAVDTLAQLTASPAPPPTLH